jgi:L-gulonolactone oxidase
MPTLTNWNHEIRFDVAEGNYKLPANISEVQDIVKTAHANGTKVRVVGAIHSTTECMVGNGIIISMEKMAAVLAVDKENLLVTVQAGVSLHQLCRHLKPLGLQPAVILEFGNFQMGAVSGTHANDTAVTRGAQFSSFVYGVRLVTPTGEIREISETREPELLPFIRSHFGLFGVVCEVTLRVLPSRPLDNHQGR